MKPLKRFPYHTFLLSLYPVLALLAHNISQTAPVDAVRSALIALLLSGLALLIFRLFLKNWRRAGLIASLAVLLFFTYGRIYTPLQGAYLFGFKFGRNVILLSIFAIF